MSCLVLKARTVLNLGIANICRVLGYKVGVKFGLNSVRRIKVQLSLGSFYTLPPQKISQYFNLTANTQWLNSHCYFGWYKVKRAELPAWHLNPFDSTSNQSSKPLVEWWRIPDFDASLGDIKTVWEASRFDWVLVLAQHAAQGDLAKLKQLNVWLSDWCEQNPAYYGRNWKCGQEASIRVMHLVIATYVLRQHQVNNEVLQQLVYAHIQRIAPTISYAIAQNNNHGTSEAAALFMGGSWLVSLGDLRGLKYQRIGLKWLENRAQHLIACDGSFSQYSTNYHRVVLDTYCMTEFWRQTLQLPGFSQDLYRRLQAATDWLYQMTQIETGDAPNLGPNDGARLLPLTETDYRDYRPTVQLSSILFCAKRAYKENGDWNLPLRWLGLELPEQHLDSQKSKFYEDGGYGLLRHGSAFTLFNIPHYRFRPTQADALHVDFWCDGENLLRDAGTYSYNAGEDITRYFSGTEGHNTFQFDGRDQIPRISRFLFGAWLQTTSMSPVYEQDGVMKTAAGYRDYQGACHHRMVNLSSSSLVIVDTVSGFQCKGVLRWRLKPGNWEIKGSTVSNGKHRLCISSNVPIQRFELVQGWESRYYLQKTQLPVLEVEIHQAGQLTTEYHFTA